MGGEDGWGCWVVAVRGLGFRCFEVIGLDGKALPGLWLKRPAIAHY